jgi:ferredoxin-NADP reductase
MTTNLLARKEICRGTWEFTLAKPAGVEYRAGQNINLKLPVLLHEDHKGPRRTFTLASAPHEEHWMIATRMTGSGFKKTLLELPLQTELEYLGPTGSLTVQDGFSSHVFLAGGIGITPFRSMVLDLLSQPTPVTAFLFYANRNRDSIAYHDLFLDQASRRTFNYIPTLNDEPDSAWTGERRILGIELLQHYLKNLDQHAYYICGPPALVADLSSLLHSSGVVKERIFSESFWGYP